MHPSPTPTDMTRLPRPVRPSRAASLVLALCVVAASVSAWVAQEASAGPVDGSWFPATPVDKPAARFNSAMAYHPGTAKLVLFGGGQQ